MDGRPSLYDFLLLVLTFVTTKLAWDLERKRLMRPVCTRLQSLRISTLIWVLLACVATTLWPIFRLLSFAMVDNQALIQVSDAEIGRGTYGKAEVPKKIVIGFSVLLTFLGGSQILLIWVTIAESSSRLLSSKDFSDIYLKYFRRVQGVLALVLAGCIVFDYFAPSGVSIQGYVISANFAALGWGYMFTSRKLRDMFSGTKPESRRKSVMLTQTIYQRIDDSVTTAAYRMTASIVLMCISWTASSSIRIYGFKEIAWKELDTFSMLALVDNIVVTAVVFFLWAAVFYLWRITFYKLHDDLHYGSESLVESFRQSFRLAFTPFSHPNPYASRMTFKRNSLAVETEVVIHDI